MTDISTLTVGLDDRAYDIVVGRDLIGHVDEITSALSQGDRVELRGFGAFSVKQRGARVGRNPRTGATVDVDSKHIPYFKTGKQLREKLNGS